MAFGGLAGAAVIIAVLVSMLGLAGFFGYDKPSSGAAAATTAAEHGEDDEASQDDADASEGEPEAEESRARRSPRISTRRLPPTAAAKIRSTTSSWSRTGPIRSL